MHFLFRCGLSAMAFAALNAGAQSAVPSPVAPPPAASSGRPDPIDASTAVPATPHRTALTGYRRLTDEPPRGWRESNDTVTRIGGWRSYLREAQAPETKASEVRR